MSKLKQGLTPKKLFISVTSLVLVAALLITALCVAAPDRGMKVSAASVGTLTSVSGKNIIPDTYEGVNVPAGTKTMTEAQYKNSVGDGKSGNAEYTLSDNGVAAFDFHIFAEKFASTAHTCGNIAVDYLGAEVLGKKGAPEFGSRQAHDTLSVKLSYVGDTTGWSSSTNPEHMTIVFGESNDAGVPNSVTATGQVHLQSNGKNFLMGNGKKLADNIYIDDESDGEPFINITDELAEAEDYQRYLVWLMEETMTNGAYEHDTWGYGDTIDGNRVRVFTYDQFSRWTGMWGGTTIDFSQYPEETIIIDFDTYWSSGNWWTAPGYTTNAGTIINGKVTLKGTAGKRIIFNVDTTNLPNDAITFSGIEMSVDGIKNSEDSVTKDNNILWNFYKKDDGTETGTPVSTEGQITLAGTWVGTVLAPDAVVKCDAGLNGSIIAKEVTTSAETHKSDFTGEKIHLEAGKTSLTLTKKWDDDPNTRPQYISIKLLRDDKPYKTVQISANDVTVSDNGNTWTYTFDNLEATDRTGKYYRYSVDEIVPAGYTATIFNNTIINVGEKTEPVYGAIVVKKKAEGAGETPLAGAQFKLTSNGGLNLSGAKVDNADNVVITDNAITWTSTGEGFAKISNLIYGDYTVTEIGAPAGYVMEANGKNAKVDKAETPVDFINKPTKVKIAKLTEGGAMLSDATLTISSVYGTDLSGVEVEGCTLVSNDGKTITIKTTGREINLKKLPVGSYTLAETAAPEGYDIAAPISFTVDENGKLKDGSGNALTRINMTDKETPEVIPEPVHHNISINKTDGANGLPNAKLELSSVTGLDMATVQANGVTLEKITENGKVTAVHWDSTGNAVQFTGLIEGAYILKEITPPAGYKPAAPMTLEVDTDNETFTMKDDIIEMNISKKDLNSGAELKGATLKLTSTTGANLSGVEVDVDGYSATSDAVTWTTDGEEAKLSKLPAGTYTLSETGVPAGYKKASDITFTVDAYGNVSGTNVSGSTVTMYDEPVKVYIGKQYNNNGATGKLAGAKLQLTGVANGNKLDLSAVTGTINVEHPYPTVVTWTSAAAPNELRGLPDGTYTLHEIEAPEGFELSDDIELVIENGSIKSANEISVDEGGNTVRKPVTITGSTEGKSDSITMTDNKAQFYSLVLSKLDADKYLADTPEVEFVGGAKLAVFPADTVSYAAENAVIIVDTVDGTASKVMLPDGDYVLVELDAPDEYTKTNNKAYFTVNNGTLEVKSLDADELAVATNGNPKDAGLAVDAPDSYYTLETSGIFDQYGAYPSTISFALEEGSTEQYICSSFVLYKEGPNGAVEVVKQTDDTLDNPESSWNFTVGNNVANAYEPGYTYYAVITMKDTSGNIVRGDELGSLHLKLNYPLVTSTGTQQTNKVQGDKLSQEIITLESNSFPEKLIIEVAKADGTVITEADDIWVNQLSFRFLVNGKEKAQFSNMPRTQIIDGRATFDVTSYFSQYTFDPDTTYGIQCIDYKLINQKGSGYNNSNYMSTMLISYGESVGGGTEEGDAPNVGEAFEDKLENLGGSLSDTDLVGSALKDKYFESVDGVTAYVVLPNYKTPEKYDHQFSVKLTKVDENGTTITSDTASFLLLDNDGNLVTNLVKTADGVYEYNKDAAEDTWANTDASPLVTAANGTLSVNKLNEGAYSFVEVEAPANYELYDGEITFVLNLNHISANPKQVKAVNTKKTGSFAILKNDDAGNPVEGAKFKLFKLDPSNIYNPVTVKAENGYDDMIYITGNDGKVTATGLELGYFYYAVEESAPDGYTADKETKYPQLAGDQRYIVDNDTNKVIQYGIFLGESSRVKAQVLEGANNDGTGGTWVEKVPVQTDEDGNETVISNVIDAGTATIGNDATRTTFKKIDSETKQPLAGAKFKLTLKNATADAKLDFVTANVISERTVNYVDKDGNPTTNAQGESSYTEEVFKEVGLEHYHGKDENGNYEEYIIWTSTEDAQGVTLLGLPASAQYTIEEIEAPYGYEKADLSGKTVTVGTVHDAYENRKIYGTVTLTKTDSATLAALSGATFKLQQLTDGEWVDVKTDLKTNAEGKITVDDLAYGGTFRFVETAAPIGYEIIDAESDSFTVDGDNTAECVYYVNASNKPEVITIRGSKTWDDDENNDRIRPESITVHLFANDTEVASKTVTSDDNWAYEFTNLLKYKDGSEIKYTITEDAVEGYTTTIDGYNITNTHKIATVEISGTKIWDDNNDQDGIRPDSVTVRLFAGENEIKSATVDEKSGWAYTFKDLPKYNDGVEIEYTVTEDAVDNYTTTQDGYNFTNSYTPGKTNVTVKKTWTDNNDQDGIRPDSITVHLFADSKEVASKEVTADDNWTYTFENLPKNRDGGTAIVYTVTEDAVEGYTTAIDGYNITNTHVTETTSVSGTKTWVDNNDQDGVRPDSITVNLLADGNKVASKEVTADDNWTYTFADLPKNRDGGTEIVYTVTEDPVESYTTTQDGYDFTNSYTPGVVSVSGVKTWDDDSDRDGVRPDFITIRLYADGTEVASKDVTAADGWRYTFSGLPKFKDGVAIVYTVTEDAVEGYTTVQNGYNFKNTHIIEKVNVEGTKTWIDNNNFDGLRPESITIRLYADGTEIDSKTVTASDNWTYTFADLPKNRDGGTAIIYTVNEDAVAYYETGINGYNVTNTHAPLVGSITLTAKKTLEGKTLENEKFSFTLKDSEGNVIETVNNNGAEIEFTALAYNYSDIGVHTYTIIEEAYDSNGITNDTTVYTVNVTVAHNGGNVLTVTADKNGSDIEFVNKYVAEKVTLPINGVKNYNRPLAGNDFTFVLSGTDLDEAITVKNDADGNFTFGDLEFTETGLYYYTITEVDEGKGGIDYDDSVINVTVVVTDNTKGKLEAKPIITRDGKETDIEFTNEYTVEKTNVIINGVKNLEGRDLKTGEFTFVLSGSDLDEALTATNVGDKFIFGAIEYTEEGTYTYTVSEQKGTLGGVDYDETVYTVTVTVVDNKDGTLTATPSINGSAIAFNNTYTADATIYTVSGTKVLSGSDLDAEQFEFILSGTDLDEPLKAKNDANGIFTFEPITYTEAGTYKYIVSEVIPEGDKAGIKYDSNTYEITVSVIDVGNGKLQAAGPENITDMLKFTNIYTAEPTKISVNGVKTLIGGTLTADEFTFTLTGEGESQSVKNTASGTFAFADISFDKEGVYTYTIKEEEGTAKNYSYDATEYIMTVTVTDNGHGELEATRSIVKKGETGETGVRFTNEVIAADLTLSKKEFADGPELPGATLILKPTGGEDITTVVRPDGVEIKNGALTWESGETEVTIGMVPNGIYEFTEITAPDGYDVAETIYVKVSGSDIYRAESKDTKVWNKETTGTVIMKDAPNSLVLSKKEFADGPELPGATLILKPVTDTKLDKVILPDDVSCTDNVISWTSDNETTQIGRVPDGIYEFTEITAPDGYEVAETIYVKVSASDIYYADSATSTAWKSVGESDTVIMIDAPTKVVISKQSTIKSDELPGAVLTIEPADGYKINLSKVSASDAVDVTESKITWTSTNEMTEIERLPQGVYKLTETTAPSGYEVDEVAYFKVSGSDIYSVKEKDYKGKNTVWTQNTDETVIMKDAYNTLVLSKVEFGAGDEILNAMLTLEATSSDTDLTQVITGRTDIVKTKGSISWVSTEKKLDLHYVPDGIYKFIEVMAPDGYEKAEFIYVKVENGKIYNAKWDEENNKYGDWQLVKDDIVIMEDKPTELVLSKIAFGGGTELPGAVLKLEPYAGDADISDVRSSVPVTVTDTMITWRSGEVAVELEKLHNGVYKFTEITAPQGYEIAETIYVKVSGSDIYSVLASKFNDDDTAWGTPVKADTVIMVDHPVVIPKTANIGFKKYSDLNKILPGAKFTLTGSNGFNKTSTSGTDGAVLFTAVPEGEYTLAEVSAPINYKKSENTIKIKVDSEGNVSYFGTSGNAIDIMGVEQLMKNMVIPIEDEKKVTVGDIISLGDQLIKENPDLAGENVVWESKDTSIAVVDQNGNVTIKKPGKVTINAYKDGVIVGTFVLGAAEENLPPVQNPSNNTPDTGETDTPVTGDDNNNIIAMNIALVSLAVALVTGKMIYNRRRKRANAED